MLRRARKEAGQVRKAYVVLKSDKASLATPAGVITGGRIRHRVLIDWVNSPESGTGGGS